MEFTKKRNLLIVLLTFLFVITGAVLSETSMREVCAEETTPEIPCVAITAVKMEDIPEDFTAGSVFQAVITVQNTTKKAIEISPDECVISWKVGEESEQGTQEYESCTGTGECIEVGIGETKNITIPVTISKFALEGRRVLESIDINNYMPFYYLTDGKLKGQYAVEKYDEELEDYISASEPIGELDYQGELDFAVAGTTPDREAPYVETMSVDKADINISVSDAIGFSFKFRDVGSAEPIDLWFKFVDEDNPENYLYFSSFEKLGIYDPKTQIFTYASQVKSSVLDGSYVLDYIAVRDEVNNYRYYYGSKDSDGYKLTDDEGNQVEMSNAHITVTHDHQCTTEIKKATTTQNGKITKSCTRCKAIVGQEVIYYPKTIALSATSYTYNGKVRKPSVTVKGSDGKTIAASNYTVTYSSGRKNVGQYTVKVTFKGNYSGTVSKTFTIKPKGTSISKLSAGKKRFTVKWKKQTSQTTGYQIQYSTSKNFKSGTKTTTVSKNKTTSRKISKLKAKKKYYVRIRTYKTVKVNGKSVKIYSDWSKVKTVKTKK